MAVWRARRTKVVVPLSEGAVAEAPLRVPNVPRDAHAELKQAILARMQDDRAVLDQLRAQVQSLRHSVRPITPVTATSLSLVATDGGNNALRFDPFLVQIVRVVDSSNNEYCLEAVTPTTDIAALSAAQFDTGGAPRTALGTMMAALGVRRLQDLSPMIKPGKPGRPVSPSWVQAYRELVEWAILFRLVRERDFATDTLLIYDGLLRSKVFARDLFKRYRQRLEAAIAAQWAQHRRIIYVAGVAKHSAVLTRYRLALLLEQVLTTTWPAYIEIPRDLEEATYRWAEYARGDDREVPGREVNKFVAGKMFFVKFGSSPHDPIWPVDILTAQVQQADRILGCMLNDAQEGFPIPLYPQSLQRAHEHAALVDFDFTLLQDHVYEGIRGALGVDGPLLDVFQLHDADPARLRYS